MAMSPRLCARKPLFHRHFRDFVRNRVDLRRFFAQQSRLTASWIFRTKEAQNARKSPQIAHFCSALPCIVICVVAQCRRAYSCNKIRQSPNSIISLQIAVFCVLWLGGVLDRSPSQIATQGFLGAYTGIFTAEKKKA